VGTVAIGDTGYVCCGERSLKGCALLDDLQYWRAAIARLSDPAASG
jgi:hypothetical protein